MDTNTVELTPEQKQARKEMIKRSWLKRQNTVQKVIVSAIEDVNEIPELIGG